MSDKRYIPVEEQSLSLPFFILASLLCGSTLWAVYDETFSRRPWKTYQNRFADLQLEQGADELKAAEAARASGDAKAKSTMLGWPARRSTAVFSSNANSLRFVRRSR